MDQSQGLKWSCVRDNVQYVPMPKVPLTNVTKTGIPIWDIKTSGAVGGR